MGLLSVFRIVLLLFVPNILFSYLALCLNVDLHFFVGLHAGPLVYQLSQHIVFSNCVFQPSLEWNIYGRIPFGGRAQVCGKVHEPRNGCHYTRVLLKEM